MQTEVEKICFPIEHTDRRKAELPYEFVITEKAVPDIHCSLYTSKTNSNKYVIYVHGNCETISTTNMYLGYYVEKLNCNFIAYDWPGYGETPGRPTEENYC